MRWVNVSFCIGIAILSTAVWGQTRPSAPIPSPAPNPPSAPVPRPNPPPKTPDPRIPQARADVVEAEKRLAAAKQRLGLASQALRAAMSDREIIARQVADANELHGDLQRQIVGREREAKSARASLDHARQQQSAADKTVSEHRKSAIAAQRSIQETTAELEKSYLKQPETLQRRAAIEDAEAAVVVERDRVITALSKDEIYRQMKSNADAREIALKQLRDDPNIDSITLTEVSQKWIDAKSRVDAAERTACAQDTRYTAAAEKLAVARQSHDAALAAFKAQLPDDPGIAPHQAALAQANQDLRDAETKQKQIDHEFRKFDAAATAAVAQYNQVADRLGMARAKRDHSANNLRLSDQSVCKFQQQLNTANTEVREATRLLADAKRKLAELEKL